MTADLLGLPGYADAVPVATGGTSTVWRARETAFDRLVAVKVIAFPVLDEDVRRRFTRELAMAGRLSGHPGVLTVHASGFTPDGRPYLTSEWCPAGSLADVVTRSGPLTDAQVAQVGVAVAEALQAAHDSGVVHRDVKPQNVFVTAYGRPALADFGIAVATAEVTSPTDSLTPSHAAPEVLQGGTAGPPADVWGLGSTLWTLLTGTPPYAAAVGEGVLPAMLRVLSDPLPPEPASPVAEVLRGLLAKDPADRPTAAQAAERLRPLSTGATALPPAGSGHGEPSAGRAPGWPGAAATVHRAGLAGASATGRAAAAGGAPAGGTPAGAVFPLLPPSSPAADATVHRPARPPAPADEPPRRDRRVLAVAGAAAAVLLVAAVGWALTQRDGEREVVAVSGPAAASAPAGATSPSSSAAPSPSAAPLLPGAPPLPAAVVPGAPPAEGAAAEPAPELPPPGAPAADAQEEPAAPAPRPATTAPRPAPATTAPAPRPAPQPNRIAVYRCDRGAEDLLYSTNPSCKPGYTQIRQAWSVTKDTGVPGTTPLWRLRNTSSGVHLLTFDSGERNRLLGGGWEADGQVGWVRTTAAEGWTRIWRLHDGTRYAYTNDASLQVWKDRGFRVEAQFWS